MARRKPARATAPDDKKSDYVHTKRRQVEYDDGWTLIVDSPKKNKVPVTTAFHGGDFEINGVGYVTRTLEEMKADSAHWKKAWEESDACRELKEKLEGMDKIENAVVLGLGSLQSSRREGRRASATQLAALQTIVEVLGGGEVVLQDPQYTDLDKEFLMEMGYKIVDDPGAFAEIGLKSLIYAIHCYGPVYKSISDGPKPRILIGTDVENFGRFDRFNSGIKDSLEELVKGCDVLDFPQIRHDFSDTKIYWRKEVKS